MKGWTKADIDRIQNKGAKPSAKQNYQALGRMKTGKMNNTEKRYAAFLESQKTAGEILGYWFEPMNLRLADNCFYKIDFLVLKADERLEVREVKGGYVTDDALVKIKTAAEKFPFKFIMYQWVGKEWKTREF